VIDVSILTPSLGYGRFLTDNILSVSRQDGVTVQHIVQDAGSTDETQSLLEKFDHVDWDSEPDRGQSDALNKAFARAEGRWVAWLNADEFYLPGGLAALIRHGDATSADIVYGDSVFVDADGRFQRLLTQHRFRRSVLWYRCFISSSSVIFRRSALPSEPWDLKFKRIMDWDLYLRMASRGARFSYRRYPVGAFRVHQERITAKPSPHFWDEYTTLVKRYEVSLDTRRRSLARLHRAYKLANGAYWKQVRARKLLGRGLRWFANDEGRESCEALLNTCYSKRLRPTHNA
jgi:glycosyltransferase involved in cell wall biosynthesis